MHRNMVFWLSPRKGRVETLHFEGISTMSDKSGWQGFGKLLNGLVGGKQTAKPLPTSTRRCDAGHPMAMDWNECPYCKAALNAGVQTTRVDEPGPTRVSVPGADAAAPRTTRIDQPPQGAAVSPRQMSGGKQSADPRRTKILGEESDSNEFAASVSNAPPNPGAQPRRRDTIVHDPSEPSAVESQRHLKGGRRLTGIVATFSWSPLGQLFTVHDGRNYAGSGTVIMEGQRNADILVPEDGMLSSVHFLILCQGGKYRISDVNSTNGTYVNGVQIDALGIELADHAQIQAGATVFTFQMVRPPAPGAAKRASSTPVEDEDEDENGFREDRSI